MDKIKLIHFNKRLLAIIGDKPKTPDRVKMYIQTKARIDRLYISA